MKKIRKAIIAVWKIFVGASFCQFPLTSILAVGWTYRAMHAARAAEKQAEKLPETPENRP